METDEQQLPVIVTLMVAKVNFRHFIERTRTHKERFLVVRGRQPEALILGIDDFLNLTGLGQDWIERAWKAAQES